MRKPKYSKAQIIAAIQRTAMKLGRAPSRAELLRIAKITREQVETHFRSYGDAVREAELEPNTVKQRVDSWVLLSDWGRVTREMGRPPSRDEYLHRGNHGYSTLESRFGNWNKVRERFCALMQERGRLREWADVLEMIGQSPVNQRSSFSAWQRLLQERKAAAKKSNGQAGRSEMPDHAGAVMSNEAVPVRDLFADRHELRTLSSPGGEILPPQLPLLEGKKRVPHGAMWTILFAMARTRTPGRSLAGFVAIQPFGDRPVMGAPINMGPLANAPVNEMGVMCLFVLLAKRLGFIIDVVRSQFPDCEARVEVEPGRWQRVRIEFEFESLGFRNHKHDPEGCDVIVCWRHNWAGCPKRLVVVELSKVIAGIARDRA